MGSQPKLYSHPTLAWAMERLRDEEFRRRDPTIAVLGPAGSGKTDVLRALLAHAAQSGPNGPRKPVLVELRGTRIGSDRAMSEEIVVRLEQALRAAGFSLRMREAQDPMRRFDSVLIDAANESGAKLMLAFDHIEAIPRALAISLTQRLRSLRERSDNVSELGLLIAGAISLNDLTRPSRHTSSEMSEFDAKVIQMPRPDLVGARTHIEQSLQNIGLQNADPSIVDTLVSETWGEPCFLNSILDRIVEHGIRLTPELLQQSVNAVHSSEVLHLRHAILHLHFDQELRNIVQDVLNEKRVLRRGKTIDVDEFQLTGVVVLDSKEVLPAYTMRNAMVTRLARHFLNKTDFESREPRLSREIEDLNRARRRIDSVLTIGECNRPLRHAWRILTSFEPPRLYALVAAADYSVRRVFGLQDGTEIPPFVERAIVTSRDNGLTAFDSDTDQVTIAIPLRGVGDVFCSLAATVTYSQGDFTEYSLQHWMSFVRSVESSLVRLTVAEALKLSWNERKQATGVANSTEVKPTAQMYLNIKSGEALLFRPGGLDRVNGIFDEGWVRRVHDLDQHLVDSGMDRTHFEKNLERVGADVAAVLQGISKVTEWLTLHAESHNWVIASPVDGLKLPFELLHDNENKTPLLLKTGVARRIQGFDVPEGLRRPIPGLLKWLVESQQPLCVLLVGTDTSGKLPVEDEIMRVRRKIESGAATFQLKCEIIEIPPELASAERVQKEFRKRPIHFFHFCGHGYQEGNEGGIVLNAGGQSERVSSGQLGSWMINRGLWLVYLSACRTAATSGDGLILSSGLFEDVLAAGVPNVIGFRWPVTWKSALVLAEEFYNRLLEPPRGNDPVTAMLHGRLAAKGMSGPSDAWASSVVVTQCPM